MSSSSWLYNARRYGFDLPKRIKALEAKFNEKITDDISDEGGEELQTRSEGGIGRSYLKFCDADLSRLDDSLTSTIIPTIQSCPTFEPDNDTCKLIVEFNNVGGYIPDTSGYNHHAKGFGVGRIRWGIRYGYGPLSLESVFDGRTNYASIGDHHHLDFLSMDFTIMFRFSPYDLTTAAVHSQAIIAKRDKNNVAWYCFEIASDGSATFNLILSTVQKYSISAPAGTITSTAYTDVTSTTPRYDVVITYAYLTQTLKMYINNVAFTSMSTTIPTTALIPDYDSHDLMIGRWTALMGKPVTLPKQEGVDDPFRLFSKLYFGTFQQLKYFQNKVLTTTEISNHYTNKVTISAVPFGEVAIPNGSMIPT